MNALTSEMKKALVGFSILVLCLPGITYGMTASTVVVASDTRATGLDYDIEQLVEAISNAVALSVEEKQAVVEFLKKAVPNLGFDPKVWRVNYTNGFVENFRRLYALSAVSYVRNAPQGPWIPFVSDELLYNYVVPLFIERNWCNWDNLTYEEIDFRPVLLQLAEGITNSTSDPYDAARALCSWVYRNIKYEQPTGYGVLTPLETLESRKGVCKQKAELFVALCESIGLPARLVYIDRWTHVAAQVYVLSKGWVPADPTIESHLFDVHEGYLFHSSHLWHACAICPIMGDLFDVTYYYSLDGLLALTNLTETYIADQETVNSLRTLSFETQNAFKNQDYDIAQAKGSILKDLINRALPVSTINVTFVNEENNETLSYATVNFYCPLVNFLESSITTVTNENGQAEIALKPCYYRIEVHSDMYTGELYEILILPDTNFLVISIPVQQYCLESNCGMVVDVTDEDTYGDVWANVRFIDEDTREEVVVARAHSGGTFTYNVLCFREPYTRRKVYVEAEASGYKTARTTAFTMHFSWDREPLTIRISKKEQRTYDVGEPFTSPQPYVWYLDEFYVASWPVASFLCSAGTLALWTNEYVVLSAPEGCYKYTWDFGDGNVTTVLSSAISHAYSEVGKYPVSLNVTRYGLWNTTEKTITVTFATDLNRDKKVNILDIFTISEAYGSKPGDENWNTIADLNKDNVINILDVFAVAWDFGKTV
jgi:hypothetical protein